jgi:hypothetical protein
VLSPDGLTTCQAAAAEMTRNIALLALDAHKQAKRKAWQKILESKFPYSVPRSVFAANFRLITGRDYLRRHLNWIKIKNSPTRPLCNDIEEMDLNHIQKCQSLTDNMDKAKNWGKWWNVSKQHWTARKKMEDISLAGVGYKKWYIRESHRMCTVAIARTRLTVSFIS